MDPFKIANQSPGLVSRLLDVPPETVRDWRRVGILEDYGEQSETGRWKYSLNDIVGMWIAERICQRGRVMERGKALRLGRTTAQDVVRAALAISRGHKPHSDRYVIALHDGNSADMRVSGSSIRRLSKLDDLGVFDFAEIIDLHRLAQTIPPEIAGLLIAAAENEADDLVPDMSELND